MSTTSSSDADILSVELDGPAAVPPYSQLVGRVVDLYTEAATASTRLRMLLQESSAVAEELSLPSLHRRVVEAIGNLVQVRGAALAVLRPDGGVAQLLQRDDGAEVVGSVTLDPSVMTALSTLLRPLAPMTVNRLGPDGASALPAPWSDGFTAIPAHYRRSVLAVVLVAEPEVGLSLEDEDLLLSLAASSGTAIENARLYEEARRRQEWLQEAAELSGGALLVASEEEAVELVARSVQRLADTELVAAWVPDGHQLRLKVALGDQASSLSGLAPAMDDPLVRELTGGAGGMHLERTDRLGTVWSDELAAVGIGPVMALPLLGDSGLRGVLLAGRNVGRPPFGQSDLDMAATFAGRVTMALDLIRARSVQERVAKLEDRERIARDLHHHVASWLLATGLKVQGVIGYADDPQVHGRLHEVVQDIDLVLQRVRSSVFPLDESDPTGPEIDRYAPG